MITMRISFYQFVSCFRFNDVDKIGYTIKKVNYRQLYLYLNHSILLKYK